MLSELRETWERMHERGRDGEVWRRNVEGVWDAIARSMESGESKGNMMKFEEWFTDKE